jgi:hypothetical protein
MDQLLRTVMWQGIWRAGAEWCELWRSDEGWRIAGTALVSVDGDPERVQYELALDAAWATRAVRFAARGGDGQERGARLTVDQDKVWRIERFPASGEHGDDLGGMRGLVDVDLGFSPATNTLPIRRLAPAIGEAVEVTAVWVRFPELTIAPLPQRYTRLEERRYRYESNGGAFVAELEVDELGLVITYEGGWQRIATAGDG